MAPASATEREALALGRLMLAFEGTSLPEWVGRRFREAPAAGVTLFRHLNVESPGQVRELTDALRAAAPAEAAPLVAADQEGGQFLALGEGPTPFAGQMALGATFDTDLAERVGRAVGTELAAMGLAVNYAPVADVATNPANPSLGIRSFGDDAPAAAEMAAAVVRGIQSAGVAATLKHFPGKGESSLDTHHELSVVEADRERFERIELAPFRAGIEAGARLVMSGHFAVPGLTEDPSLPSTLSRAVMRDLLRVELGFDGLTITDALDMRALTQGPAQVVDVIAAVRAGVDLLLSGPDGEARERIELALRAAAARRLFDDAELVASAGRRRSLRDWLAGFERPDLGVVGSPEHLALAVELARRSITLVRDEAGLLPIAPAETERVAAVMPRPIDLTPADTSSLVEPALAAALRRRFDHVDEFVTSHPPADAEIAAIRAAVGDHDFVVIGTINAGADPQQVALVRALGGARPRVLTVALRTPWDIAAYPEAGTHLATYSILPGSLAALADALVGAAPTTGRLPVTVAGVAPRGHGLTAVAA
jgi:beta-N-acetylhexosaminidase